MKTIPVIAAAVILASPAAAQDLYKFMACRLNNAKCAVIDREIREEDRYAQNLLLTRQASWPGDARLMAFKYGVARAARLPEDVQYEIARIRNCRATIRLIEQGDRSHDLSFCKQ